MTRSIWRSKVVIVVVSAAVAVLLPAACSGMDDPTESRGAENSAGNKVDYHVDLECRESVTTIPIDPALARMNVPADYTLALYKGVPYLSSIVQECTKATFDGIDYAPISMVHVWIGITGPPEVLPVPGAVHTQPTLYWYGYAEGSTDTDWIESMRKAGVYCSRVVENIELGLPTNGTVSGSVVEETKGEKEGEGKRPVGYRWVEHINPAPGSAIGLNHRIFVNRGKEEVTEAFFSGLIVPFGMESPTVLSADPDSTLGEFGENLEGLSKEFTMTFSGVISTNLKQ